jgi:hypothetical protein
MRELRLYFANERRLIGILLVGLIAGISGPFETITQFSLGPRIAYWVWVAFSTFFIGSFVRILIAQIKPVPSLKIQITGAFLNAVVVTGYIIVLNTVILPTVGVPNENLVTFMVLIGIIVFAITLMVEYFSAPAPQDTGETPLPQSAEIFKKIPQEKRGALVSLSSEDHYVRVETDKGSSTILIRLADAIALCSPIEGVRVHRSHWVAVDHVVNYSKSKDRWALHLSNGHTIPISRRYRATVIEAGLIPARG